MLRGLVIATQPVERLTQPKARTKRLVRWQLGRFFRQEPPEQQGGRVEAPCLEIQMADRRRDLGNFRHITFERGKRERGHEVGRRALVVAAQGMDQRRLAADLGELTIVWRRESPGPVSYTHLRAHETVLDLVCRLLLEKK